MTALAVKPSPATLVSVSIWYDRPMAEDPNVPVGASIDGLLDTLNPAGDLITDEELRGFELTAPELSIATVERGSHFTADGLLFGLPFYFRYRHGVASLKVGPSPIERPYYEAKKRLVAADPHQLTGEEFFSALRQLVPALTVAPFRYTFKGRRVALSGDLADLTLTPTDEAEYFQAWGSSPAEAFRRVSDPSPELTSLGLSEELQKRLFALQQVDPTPLQEDNREFPKASPAFDTFPSRG